MNIVGWGAFISDFLLLVLSIILGSFVGYEREVHGKSAGLRTHALVCVGSALLTVVSVKGFGPWEGLRDPGRIVGQMVAGIGFLGAGTILRDGMTIKGLTTAASLWATCFIGLATGTGMLQYAVAGTVLVVIILGQLSKVEKLISVRTSSTLKVYANDRPGLLGDIAAVLGRNAMNISKSEIDTDVDTGMVSIELELQKISKDKLISAEICSSISKVDGVRKYELHD
ncbi:MAG TPA: MgtC/SapB family protein [Bacillota bacterium]|nr:MgtC/SapB family protein [Bacillota bacterium]